MKWLTLNNFFQNRLRKRNASVFYYQLMEFKERLFMTEKTWYTVKEAAVELMVHEKTIRLLIKSKKIESRNFGTRITRIHHNEIKKMKGNPCEQLDKSVSNNTIQN